LADLGARGMEKEQLSTTRPELAKDVRQALSTRSCHCLLVASIPTSTVAGFLLLNLFE